MKICVRFLSAVSLVALVGCSAERLDESSGKLGGALAVAFDPDLSDGLVGGPDGTVEAGGLRLDVCGTTTDIPTSVVVVVDDGESQSATITGTYSWCLPGVLLAEGTHAFDVTAKTGVEYAFDTLTLTVDLTGPAAPGTPTVGDLGRTGATVSWTAPSDDGNAADHYVIKHSPTALDDTSFDGAGTEVTPPLPGAPATIDTAELDGLRPGVETYITVAAYDPAGNRSPLASFGPFTTDFTAGGAVTSLVPGEGDNALGEAIAAGDFDGDGFSDIAMAAPFKGSIDGDGTGAVYIYFGGSEGPGALPGLTIAGTELRAQLGDGLAALDWNGDGTVDLAVGAPFAAAGDGAVYVYLGGNDWTTAGTFTEADADVAISVSATSSFYTGGLLGFALAPVRFDDDGRDDLAIASPIGGGGNGGVTVLYGGATASSIVLSDSDASGLGGAVGSLIVDPVAGNDWDGFGASLAGVGSSGGATDGLAIARFFDDEVFVYRGRAAAPTSGIEPLTFSQSVDLALGFAASATWVLGSIDDDGDGARDLVLGAYTAASSTLYLVDGNRVGIVDAATATTATVAPASGDDHIGMAVASGGDVDGDGLEDLVAVGGGAAGVALHVWYGGALPAGAVDAGTAAHSLAAPQSFQADRSGNGEAPVRAAAVGDVDGDGAGDFVWADWVRSDRDGSFELLR